MQRSGYVPLRLCEIFAHPTPSPTEVRLRLARNDDEATTLCSINMYKRW